MVMGFIKNLVWPTKQVRADRIQKFDLKSIAMSKSLPLMSGESVIATMELEPRLVQIKLKAKVTDDEFKRMYEGPILRLAESAQLSPASESYHHYELGGFIVHTLEVIDYALSERAKYFLPEGATIEEQLDGEHRWTYAVFVCALLHDVGKLSTQHTLVLSDGDIFTPYSRFRDFVKDGAESSDFTYNLDFNRLREYEDHQYMGLSFLSEFFSYRELIWLSSDKVLFKELTEYLSNNATNTASFSKIISAADSRSTGDSLNKSELSPFIGAVASKQEGIWRTIRGILQKEIESGRHHNTGSMLKLDGEYIYINAEMLRMDYAVNQGLVIPADSDTKEKDAFVNKLTRDFSDTAQFIFFTTERGGVVSDGVITTIKYYDQMRPEGILWKGQMVVRRDAVLGVGDTHPTLTQISRGGKYILPINDQDMMVEYILWRQKFFADNPSFEKERGLSLSGMLYYLEKYMIGEKWVKDGFVARELPISKESVAVEVGESVGTGDTIEANEGEAVAENIQNEVEQDNEQNQDESKSEDILKQQLGGARKRRVNFNADRSFEGSSDSSEEEVEKGGGAKNSPKKPVAKNSVKPSVAVSSVLEKKVDANNSSKDTVANNTKKEAVAKNSGNSLGQGGSHKKIEANTSAEKMEEKIGGVTSEGIPAKKDTVASGIKKDAVANPEKKDSGAAQLKKDSGAVLAEKPKKATDSPIMQKMIAMAGFDSELVGDDMDDMKEAARTPSNRSKRNRGAVTGNPVKNATAPTVVGNPKDEIARKNEQSDKVKKAPPSKEVVDNKRPSDSGVGRSLLEGLFKRGNRGGVDRQASIMENPLASLGTGGSVKSDVVAHRDVRKKADDIRSNVRNHAPDYDGMGIKSMDLEMDKEALIRRMKVPLSRKLEVIVNRVTEQALAQDRFTFGNITAMLKTEGLGVLTHSPKSKSRADRATGVDGKDSDGDVIKSVYAWDVIALPEMSENPTNEELGVVFLQWLAVVIYSRKYEVNSGPIHKINGQYLALASPVLILEFLADYGLYSIPDTAEKDERESYNKDVSGRVRNSASKVKAGGGEDILLFIKSDKGTKLGKNIFTLYREGSIFLHVMLVDIKKLVEFIKSNEMLDRYLDNSFEGLVDGIQSNVSLVLREGVFR